MTHPFDDLTEEELKELVDFCQKYFFSCSNCGDHHGEDWEWKKGDWFYYKDKAYLVINVTGVKHKKIHSWGPGGTTSLKNFFPTDPIIPLPLAHQWDQLFFTTTEGQRYAHDTYDDEGDDVPPEWFFRYVVEREIYTTTHDNPHYRRFLAFRKVIENGSAQ